MNGKRIFLYTSHEPSVSVLEDSYNLYAESHRIVSHQKFEYPYAVCRSKFGERWGMTAVTRLFEPTPAEELLAVAKQQFGENVTITNQYTDVKNGVPFDICDVEVTATVYGFEITPLIVGELVLLGWHIGIRNKYDSYILLEGNNL